MSYPVQAEDPTIQRWEFWMEEAPALFPDDSEMWWFHVRGRVGVGGIGGDTLSWSYIAPRGTVSVDVRQEAVRRFLSALHDFPIPEGVRRLAQGLFARRSCSRGDPLLIAEMRPQTLQWAEQQNPASWNTVVWPEEAPRAGDWFLLTTPATCQGHVDAFLDLARAGQEQDFRDLAAMLGVPANEREAMWQGTRRRLGA